MDVKLLTDKNKLQEIYDLRVKAFQHSPYSKYINKKTYPKGYFDKLDPLETTYHWILENNQAIIGSVRVAVIKDAKDIDLNFSKLNLPKERPFGYCGRTAVHPDFRSIKTLFQLDHVCKRFILDNSWIKFGLCCVGAERVTSVKRLGFTYLGDVVYDWGNGNETTLKAYILLN